MSGAFRLSARTIKGESFAVLADLSCGMSCARAMRRYHVRLPRKDHPKVALSDERVNRARGRRGVANEIPFCRVRHESLFFDCFHLRAPPSLPLHAMQGDGEADDEAKGKGAEAEAKTEGDGDGGEATDAAGTGAGDKVGKKRSRDDGGGGGDREGGFGRQNVSAKTEAASAAGGGAYVQTVSGGEKSRSAPAAQLPKVPAPVPVPPALASAQPASAWRVYYDQLGRPYYHNSVTKVTQWTPPVV